MLNKILIVDDSDTIHQNYKMTLKRYNCEMISALSREEGLKKVAETSGVDLVLVDMNMSRSRISGIEFIKTLREQVVSANIPIVAVTTRGFDYAKEALIYADGNLIKPFTSSEVHSVIEKAMSQVVSV